MLFTTAAFVALYLPLVLAGFFVIGRWSHGAAASWLFAASLLFYGVWMPEYVLLLLGSIVGNFWIGQGIAAKRADGLIPQAKILLIVGVSANLLLLAYYKYANFFVDNLNAVLGTQWQLGAVLLPIGISFFSFTQIAFLADSYQKGTREYRFSHYGLFVTYFPHLIAGPVLHHAQMMPQFRDPATYRIQPAMLAAGLAIFVLGLVKKVVLADGISPYADAVFNPADAGMHPDFHEAWLGALAYTFQLYFDFSGYSDMAIGISLLFNVRLPFNFDSPYRASNISDFWRRWHISLSNFLRDYLYIALGGNRKGALRRYLNLGATMLLGGLWHGASWSFVLWGGLHGLYLMLNHGFSALCGPVLKQRLAASRAYMLSSWLLTMLAVVLAWVFFRATTLDGALRMIEAMLNPSSPGLHRLLWEAGLQLQAGWTWCAVLAAIAFLAPNSNSIGQRLITLCQQRVAARALLAGAAIGAIALLVLLNTARSSVSAFIYFNF
ncbi:MBOAT family O-acyltransferase [Paucibacter sp. XJ19-41]|uniref:MBOAT family O-acyltransferase n=1 Tax=Paucibacter sp. XJ19-41 TaxID=2927824 RepID=UPI002348F836|nr:MBOAT family O-acyltransferase [Paucibacter sp. XJ19-41]MDC6170510.1 MBOAT family protein [Paucibacter sp. XJ19-41]